MESIVPCAEARTWMLDNAAAQEYAADVLRDRGDSEQAKLCRDCAWAFRYVAEKAKDAEGASVPNISN